MYGLALSSSADLGGRKGTSKTGSSPGGRPIKSKGEKP